MLITSLERTSTSSSAFERMATNFATLMQACCSGWRRRMARSAASIVSVNVKQSMGTPRNSRRTPELIRGEILGAAACASEKCCICLLRLSNGRGSYRLRECAAWLILDATPFLVTHGGLGTHLGDSLIGCKNLPSADLKGIMMTPVVDVGLENGTKKWDPPAPSAGCLLTKADSGCQKSATHGCPRLGYKGFCAGGRRSSVQSLLSVDSFDLLGPRPD